MSSAVAFAIVVFIAKFLFAECYNFDTKFADVFSSNFKNDYFGFSVLLQKGNPSLVIVGATKGNSSLVSNAGKSPGVLFKCALDNSKICREYTLGHRANAVTDQELLGAVIDGGQSVGDPIIACAPRLKREQIDGYLGNGACFILGNSTLTEEFGEIFIPLSDDTKQNFNRLYLYGHGEAGVSLHFLQEYSQILIGAPGVYKSKGTLIRYQLQEPFKPQLKLAYQIQKLSIPHPYYSYNMKMEYDSYLGYSSSYGIFDENKDLWYVAAAPRAFMLKGKVYIFSYPYTDYQSIIVHREFTGEQIGAYFGFSLLSFKNRDSSKVSDLLIGAPMFSLKGYDEGCVYYYKNDGRAQFRDPVKIFGDTTSGSRFGYAVANLGDINHDSYTDVAISAPFESKEKGAVYIFLGQHNGLSNKYSQKITGRSIDGSIVGLGLSLSKGLDIDHNSFNDLAIGDFKSGKVVVVKTKPVIKYLASLEPDVRELRFSQNIQFNLTFCLGYDSPNGIVKSVETVLHYYPDYRIVMDNKISTVTIKLNKFYCETLNLTLIDHTFSSSGFTNPIRFKINYEVKNESSVVGSGFCKTCPVTDPGVSNSVYREIPYATGCKNASVCFPDLNVSAKFDPNLNYLVIGENTILNLKVEVTNSEEPAYMCTLILKIPDGIEMRRIPNKCAEVGWELHCFLKNVIFKNSTAEIVLEFDLTRLTSYLNQKEINFYLEVKSSGEDTNKYNNKINLSLPLKVESFVQINGETQSDPLIYSLVYTEPIKFAHRYTFVNLGPSPSPKLSFAINFPFKINSQKFISKYSFQSTTRGVDIECDESLEDYVYEDETNLLFYYAQTSNSTDINKTLASFPADQISYINCTGGEGGVVTCKKLLCHVRQEFKKDQIISIDFLIEIAHEKRSEFKKLVSFQTDISLRLNQQARNETISVTSFILNFPSNARSKYKVYIIGAVVGIMILSGIVFLLHKLKFFRRPLMEKLINAEESVQGGDGDGDDLPPQLPGDGDEQLTDPIIN